MCAQPQTHDAQRAGLQLPKALLLAYPMADINITDGEHSHQSYDAVLDLLNKEQRLAVEHMLRGECLTGFDHS
jgi:hypothetical protein